VDCGIAMAHLRLAGEALGLRGAWQLAEGRMQGAGSEAECVARYVLDASAPSFD